MDVTSPADPPPAEATAGMPAVDTAAPSPRLAENPEGLTQTARPSRFEEQSAIPASLPPAGVAPGRSALLGAAHLDTPVKSGAIEDLLNAADGSVKAVRHIVPEVRPPSRDEAIAPMREESSLSSLLVVLVSSIPLAGLSWLLATKPVPCLLSDLRHIVTPTTTVASIVTGKIITVESNGSAAAENELSSAAGSGQFLDGTWLDLIRTYKPELAGRSDEEILSLRRELDLSREMVARFADRNAALLERRCLPVTPGTLYLSHFAGGAGAVAVLSAKEDADAAETMAKADSTGRTTRNMIVAANPFLEKFTVVDLKEWAEAKMITAKPNR